MAMVVYLVDEKGSIIKEVIDDRGILYTVLPPERDMYVYLRDIDPYGDTYFNRIQMSRLMDEFKKLKESITDQEVTNFLNKLEYLAQECKDGIHLYLKFEGE